MTVIRSSITRPSMWRHDTVDRMFRELTANWIDTTSPAPRDPVVRTRQIEDGYEIAVDVPGVPESAITIDVTERVLSIAVDHHEDTDTVTWQHRITLGAALDTERITARHIDGRLRIAIPRAPEAQPRRISITPGSGELPPSA